MHKYLGVLSSDPTKRDGYLIIFDAPEKTMAAPVDSDQATIDTLAFVPTLNKVKKLYLSRLIQSTI
ncbi:hypothetical protein AB6805_13470 [Chitinophaga sp. RCC_12]|uniref:hypothetical protein n=1 Tax=Chitinophaga sp. RCC_12 TaxID=3239226 RepID=UPI0035264BA8